MLLTVKQVTLLLYFKVMIRFAAVFLCLLSFAPHAVANEFDGGKFPTWTGVDIVTNDAHARDVARQVIKIHPGQIISYLDPILKIHCDNVRNLLPVFDVRCRAIQMEGGFALYAVDVETRRATGGLVRVECGSDRLPDDLMGLANSYYDVQLRDFSGNGDFLGEFININGYLDFRGRAGHQLHVNTHDALRGRFADLMRGAKSCIASDRADAIWLMNLSGFPRQTVDAAIELLEDSDGVVRNNASRTVASFVEYLPDSKLDTLLTHACRKITEEDFYERNKGLTMAASILNVARTREISARLNCMAAVVEIARNSNSAQLGESAKWILTLAVDQHCELVGTTCAGLAQEAP